MGRSLVGKYKIESLGELPQEEANWSLPRLWANATGGVKLDDELSRGNHLREAFI